MNNRSYITTFEPPLILRVPREEQMMLEEFGPQYHVRWMRHIPLLARVSRIYHYRLGAAADA
ncbi:MAG: hypothetical protein ACM30E_10495 [Nitrososphaerales archaeon]